MTLPKKAVALAVGASTLLLVGCAPWRLHTAAALAEAATPFQARPAQPERRVLVVGDSTAVGTGASAPQSSLAGLISHDHPRWRIDNLASNGARFADVVSQLEAADAGHDLVLILAGGNDVMGLTSEQALQAGIEQAVALARRKGRLVVLMPAGNVGHAPFFSPPLTWWMAARSEQLHRIIRRVAARTGAVYVSLLRPRDDDPFVQRADELNAADGLHPSDAGYRVWYASLRQQGGLTP